VYGRRRSSWVRGEQVLLPERARRAGIDLLHSLASTAPAWGPFRRVVTILDVIYRIHPEAHGWRTPAMRLLVPLAARRSQRIIVPSETSRADLVRVLGVSASKIDVVPNGIGRAAPSAPLPEPELRARYDLRARPLVSTLGLNRPHKNLRRLLDALALLPPERRPLLVVAGHPSPHEHELRGYAAQIGVDADTRFVGWLPEEALEALYRASTCFVFPSLYEGFGLPVVEAMARGVAVACSDRGALREVADHAALTFDPERTDAIAAAIERLLADPAERERLSAAGRANAARFTWDETARGTLQSYDAALAYSAATA
jgi:glycosyltransferase involved in cell wall biosynthesis